MPRIEDNGTTFEWDDETLGLDTLVKVTGPDGRTGSNTFGRLCQQSQAEVWYTFDKHGYRV